MLNMKSLGKGHFFLLVQKFLTIYLEQLSKVETFKRSAAEQDISFYRNFNNLMIFLGLNVIFIIFLGFLNSS